MAAPMPCEAPVTMTVFLAAIPGSFVSTTKPWEFTWPESAAPRRHRHRDAAAMKKHHREGNRGQWVSAVDASLDRGPDRCEVADPKNRADAKCRVREGSANRSIL